MYYSAHICHLSIKATVVMNRVWELEIICTCKRAHRSHGPDLHSPIISVLLITVVWSSLSGAPSTSVRI